MTYVIGEPCADIMDRACADEWETRVFFTVRLPGRDQPMGSPGGAARLGPAGADTDLVAARPERQTAT